MITSPTDRIFVAGHRGMAGSAVVRRLKSEPCQILVADRDRLDLCDPKAVDEYFQEQQPTGVILAAAKVGGINANISFPTEFLSENVRMSTHVIDAAFRHSVRRLIYLGSTCIYPRDCPQPIQESYLLQGSLEMTHEPYSLAKIVGLKLCQAYRRQYGVQFHSVMPTNLYGKGDNYHPDHSHVLPALLRKIHEANARGDQSVTIWGTGTARREFLHVDDLADAIVFLYGLADPPDWVNVGTGVDMTILELANLIASVVGYSGEILTDTSQPDGTPIKCTDMSCLHKLGWRHRVDLDQGIRRTYDDFLNELASGSIREV
jgi:GDP-L-fucose synthase